MTKGKLNELENMAIEISQAERERGKKMKNVQHNIQKNAGHLQRYTCNRTARRRQKKQHEKNLK